MRTTIRQLKAMKSRGDKIPMITAYDYTSAGIVDRAGVPVILVGDSLGQVMLGYDSTLSVTMEDMIYHVRPVIRGAPNAQIVVDMPFMSYQEGPEIALHNAGRLLKEGGAQSVKLEGGASVAGSVRTIVEAGIPVMGHIGLTPQSQNQLGTRVQGKTVVKAIELIDQAVALEQAGAYSIVLELVPAELAELITERLSIPTIGIGAGPGCDGQVLVFHDLLGLYIDQDFKHSRRYANFADDANTAVSTYVSDVQERSFPSGEESHNMDREVFEQLLIKLKDNVQTDENH
jgi:3-methyl-2-oxobutanoate hydroxymethyltransferase